MAANEEDVRFGGGSGHELAGVIASPDGTPRGGVLLAHCFTCSKDLHTLTRLSSALTATGWAVLRFDFAGIGESGGDFVDKTFTSNVEDVVTAAQFLRERMTGPLALFGHSLGGAATLLAAQRIGDVASVTVLAAPSTPAQLRAALGEIADRVEREGVVTATIAGRTFRVSAGLLADLERHEQEKRIAALGCPLLILHALDDEVVPVTEGEANFAAARQPKAFVPLVDTDHLVTDRRRAQEVADVVVGWLDRMA